MRVSPRLSLSTQESGNGDGHNHAMPQRSRRRSSTPHCCTISIHLMLMHRKRCAPPVYACRVTSASTLNTSINAPNTSTDRPGAVPPAAGHLVGPSSLSHARLALSTTCFTAVLSLSNSLSQLDWYHRDSTARQPPDPVPVRRGSGPPMPVCDGLMSESFDPAAQSPSSASKLSANGCVVWGAGRRHVCLN